MHSRHICARTLGNARALLNSGSGNAGAAPGVLQAMDLHEAALRWADQLTWAEHLTPADPSAAFDAHRAVAGAIEEYVEEHPESEPALAALLCRARAELERSSEAAERFAEEARERERHFHARELAMVREPLTGMRHPYPPG